MVTKKTRTTRGDDKTGDVLLVDAANVIGSRPTGWWKDRAGAAQDLRRAGESRGGLWAASPRRSSSCLEGKAREGVPTGAADGVTVLHAPGSGDDMLVSTVSSEADEVTLVTADRELRRRAEALGASVVGPGWLLSLLE